MTVQQETLGDNYSGDMQPVGELYLLEVWNVQCLDPQFSIWRSSRKACSTSCSTSKELKSPSSLVSNMSNLNTVGSAVRIVCLLQCTENMSSSLPNLCEYSCHPSVCYSPPFMWLHVASMWLPCGFHVVSMLPQVPNTKRIFSSSEDIS